MYKEAYQLMKRADSSWWDDVKSSVSSVGGVGNLAAAITAAGTKTRDRQAQKNISRVSVKE